MTSHLRRISVHVTEPSKGLFYWVLMEEGDDASQWCEISSAQQPYDLWLDALQEGTQALVRLASDQRIGPREIGDDEDSDSVGIPLGA